ncbi:regulator of microtubule dynamics protein 2 isoform X1 [Equus przewalskii]|uniref:Regulator of microtubule dynamics protein 2 n=1 Tax=Equus przewalskii TaxID=9798 RepID=A0ABM4KPN6_EQUPR
MGKCLSCYKEDQSLQPNHPADQITSDPLHPEGSSVTKWTVSLDVKATRPSAIRKVLSPRGNRKFSSPSNTSTPSSFSGRRRSLFTQFQKSNASLHHQQSRANFDAQERSFSDLKSASDHFGFRSRRPFSAPRLSIVTCYESATFFDLRSSNQSIFNPDEIEVISKNSSIANAEKYINSFSPEYNFKHFMNFETKDNSTYQNTVNKDTSQQSAASILSLPTVVSHSHQQSGCAVDGQEREQLRKASLHPAPKSYITANTDTEEQSFPVTKALNTHVEDLNLDVLLQKADRLRLEESSKMESFELLCDHKDKYRDEIEFIWRFARAYGDMYELSTNTQEKKHYANIGKTLGEKAITRAPMNGHCHLWYAILCGYVSEFEGLQNKINYGHRFKEHLDKAIQFLPEEPFLYYLKGRYCYTVSKLSWIEKKMAATLFGKIPSSTVEEALQNFLKVEELHPGFSKSNYMFLAKCYIDLEQTNDAVKFCDLAVLLPCVSREDREAQKEVKKISTFLKR